VAHIPYFYGLNRYDIPLYNRELTINICREFSHRALAQAWKEGRKGDFNVIFKGEK
jgi:hypothetical protein